LAVYVDKRNTDELQPQEMGAVLSTTPSSITDD